MNIPHDKRCDCLQCCAEDITKLQQRMLTASQQSYWHETNASFLDRDATVIRVAAASADRAAAA